MSKKELVKRLIAIGENVVFDWDFFDNGIFVSLLTNRIANAEYNAVLDELYELLEDVENNASCYDVTRGPRNEIYRLVDKNGSYELYVLY